MISLGDERISSDDERAVRIVGLAEWVNAKLTMQNQNTAGVTAWPLPGSISDGAFSQPT
jgi:streptogramin lyase